MRIDKAADLHKLGEDLLTQIESRIRRDNYTESSIRTVAFESLQELDCELRYDPEL
ncbi:MAG: hypothetical protein V2J10_07710 [Wenzhouxiangella sp.]|jgi:hypothetical protein|nr:hypothetical protein [Wenzhouxiangella sp.]